MNNSVNKELSFDIQADVLPQLAMKLGQLECNNAMIQAANEKLREKVAELTQENERLKAKATVK